MLCVLPILHGPNVVTLCYDGKALMWQSKISPQDTRTSPFIPLLKSDFHVWGICFLVEVTVYVQCRLLIFSKYTATTAQYCRLPLVRSLRFILNSCMGSLSRCVVRVIVSTSCIFPAQGHLRVNMRVCIYAKAPSLICTKAFGANAMQKTIF